MVVVYFIIFVFFQFHQLWNGLQCVQIGGRVPPRRGLQISLVLYRIHHNLHIE